MFMTEKRQVFLLHHPKKFDALAYDCADKPGLCIFEIHNTWRVLSWWNGREMSHEFPPLEAPQNALIELPFWGGWVGWITYPHPQQQILFWKTDGAICYHIKNKVYHVVGTTDFCRDAQIAIKCHSKPIPARDPVYIPSPKVQEQKLFCHQVQSLKQAIYDGMVYQANLSRRSEVFFLPNPLLHYLHIQEHNKAQLGAYLQFGDQQVLSNSPELFLHSFGLETIYMHSQPIKGTSQTNERTRLWKDNKERSELTMIADLVRNDLGKVARIGSVFTKHRSLRRCGDLLHAEQSIFAQLAPEFNIIQAIKAIFPAGSITGAPKKSAMQYIASLEQYPRGLYTGSVGFFCDTNHCHFNVAIRTLFIERKQTHLHVGCGIVYNSNPQKEWEESIAKGNALSKLLFT